VCEARAGVHISTRRLAEEEKSESLSVVASVTVFVCCVKHVTRCRAYQKIRSGLISLESINKKDTAVVVAVILNNHHHYGPGPTYCRRVAFGQGLGGTRTTLCIRRVSRIRELIEHDNIIVTIVAMVEPRITLATPTAAE